MQILFYVDALIERDDPAMKGPWIKLVGRMIQAIRRSDPCSEFLCVTGSGLETIATSELPGCRVATIKQTELVPRFGSSSLEVACNWYRDANCGSRTEMSDLIRSRIGAFIPTACISFSPAPFLKVGFGEVPVLYFELGIVSRPPFPMTGYIDNHGMFLGAYPFFDRERISNFSPSSAERALVDQLQTQSLQYIRESNPFSQVMSPVVARFKSVVLVALQFSKHYAYAVHAEFKEQFDLLLQTLDSVTDQTLVIVTEHPDYPVLTTSAIQYLQARHTNFFWIPEFRKVAGASQYLIEFSDAVVTVDSTVGQQSLLWNKRLVVAGHSQLDMIAESNSVSDLPRLLETPCSKTKTNILAWNITRYSIPLELLFESDLFVNRLRHFLPHDNSRCDTGPFDQPFAPLESIAEAYRAALDHARNMGAPSPVGSAYLPEKFAQLFIDQGEGWAESGSIHQPIHAELGHQRFRFDISRFTTVRKIRFDPVNDACVIRLISITLHTDKSAVDILPDVISNSVQCVDGVDYYSTIDPQFLISDAHQGELRSAKMLDVELDFLAIGSAAIDLLISTQERLCRDAKAETSKVSENLAGVVEAARIRDAENNDKLTQQVGSFVSQRRQLNDQLHETSAKLVSCLDALQEANARCDRLKAEAEQRHEEQRQRYEIALDHARVAYGKLSVASDQRLRVQRCASDLAQTLLKVELEQIRRTMGDLRAEHERVRTRWALFERETIAERAATDNSFLATLREMTDRALFAEALLSKAEELRQGSDLQDVGANRKSP